MCNDEPLPPGSRVSFVFLMSPHSALIEISAHGQVMSAKLSLIDYPTYYCHLLSCHRFLEKIFNNSLFTMEKPGIVLESEIVIVLLFLCSC